MLPFTLKLKELLKQDLTNLQHLHQTLELELEAFGKSESSAFQNIISKKNEYIGAVESCAIEKAKLLSESGLDIHPGQVEKTLLKLPDPELHELWAQVKNQYTICQNQNEINGKVATHSLNRVQKMMFILRGQSESPSLYSNKGNQTSLSTQQTIAQA
jgi:flagellar biosynthesis/type III secretory pathway chaperone